VGGPAARDRLLLGAGFFLAAVAIAGLPPFSGFVGKILILEATRASSTAGPLWFALLASGLVATIALSRAGARVFWVARPPLGDDRLAIGGGVRAALCWLTALLLALVVGAGPAARYTSAAAAQLANPRAYIEAVLGALAVPSPPRDAH
jgi:multicomponent K+:H+ antiporter subunit D